MNVAYRSPKKSEKSRHRTRSAGSSSVSSYGLPRTPIDGYDRLQVGALGQGFSVIKMRNGFNSDLDVEDEDASQNTRLRSRCSAPLPVWLSETFSTLTKKHPLRRLLPSSSWNKNTESSQNASPRHDSEDIFAFRPPPSPQKAAPVLQSPVAFHTYPCEMAFSTNHTSPSSHLGLFSTPGPASSICQPSPHKSYVPMSTSFSPLQPNQNERPARDYDNEMIDNAFLAPNKPLLNFAPASSLLAPPAYSATPPEGYADQDSYINVGSPAPFSNRPTSLLVRLCKYDGGNPAIPDLPMSSLPRYTPDNNGSSLDAVLHNPFGIPNAYSTPGPAYVSSRPVYFDNPAYDPPSDPPDPAYELDHGVLDFQWKPFNRNTTQLPDSKVSTGLKFTTSESYSGADGDLGSLPPSSDLFSGDDSNHSYGPPHTSKSGSLPLATSSDPVFQDEDHVYAKQIHSTEDEAYPPNVHRPLEDSAQKSVASPGPFRFNPPSRTPSLTQTIVPMDRSSLRRQMPSSAMRSDARLVNFKSPRDARQSPSAPLSPLPDSGSAQVENLDVLKNDLLNTLDRIAPDPPKRSEKSHVNDETEVAGSQDSIESWTEEQEQELVRLGR
ncbi:hypothetical protein BT96DRAFT_1011351 [Gymnopus androsaceus JB14]|uniref:Uncharacterized protein n=1 Tax=Gymnopus androsaceus JB14 TaxID=1447944 RepID=A0A6A4IPD9_9AGAR|nr:hypothetical protein BT96DRAFT_1011351 [Gymnopus androsaceus JB14]